MGCCSAMVAFNSVLSNSSSIQGVLAIIEETKQAVNSTELELPLNFFFFEPMKKAFVPFEPAPGSNTSASQPFLFASMN